MIGANEQVRTWLEAAGIPTTISDNIAGELWAKLIVNCAYNAISALSRSKYGRIARDAGSIEVIKSVIIEAVAVGKAAGVQFSAETMIDLSQKPPRKWRFQFSLRTLLIVVFAFGGLVCAPSFRHTVAPYGPDGRIARTVPKRPSRHRHTISSASLPATPC